MAMDWIPHEWHRRKRMKFELLVLLHSTWQVERSLLLEETA